jgi:DNA/RNA-binding domain of Phe-tRNA-synthetase-like protein
MADPAYLAEFLGAARIEPEVSALRPDYRALLIAVDGVIPSPSGGDSEALLQQAESAARQAIQQQPVDQLPHIAAWRDAYRAFGAKPQRTRNSVEALTRRAASGLPRVNRLTDIYNAISVLHQLPIGGEDLTRYTGAPQLIRASGSELFDTIANAAAVVENPDAGEVVWCDDTGVTCRRWNWRQASRTQLSGHTTTALFILDALAPFSDAQLEAAADDLAIHLHGLGPDVTIVRRLLSANPVAVQGD